MDIPDFIEEDETMEGGGITPFARLGGKSMIAKRLIAMFPPDEDYDIYVEPFMGAGNIILRKEPADHREIINDLDKRMVVAFRGIKKSGKYINDNVARIPPSKEVFNANKDKLNAVDIIDTIKYSFFSMGKSYNSAMAKNPEKRGNKTDYIPISERLKKVTILNQSFEKVIKKYDTPRTFFYLDPPYESKEESDYPDYVTPEMVWDSVKNVKGFVMVSYNDSAKIRGLFKSWKIKTIKTKYKNMTDKHAMGMRTKTELIIMNYQ